MKTTPAPEPTLREKIKIVAALLAIGALLLAAAMLPIVNLAQTEKAARVVAIIAPKMKVAQAAKPKKRKTKMVKIARGTTKQADLVSTDFGTGVGQWAISTGGSPVAQDYAPNGWALTESGMVSVPVTATAGAYSAFIAENAHGEVGKNYTYEFEVVCMTGTISVVAHP